MGDDDRMLVLIIEPDDGERSMLSHYLARDVGTRYDFLEAETAAAALAICKGNKPDCILLCRDLPDARGLDILTQLVEAQETDDPSVPAVLLLNEPDETTAFNALRMGAQEVLPRNELTGSNLRRATYNAMVKHELRLKLSKLAGEKTRLNRKLKKTKAELDRARKTLHEQAVRDSLTGLHNRRYFMDRFLVEFMSARRHEYDLTLGLADIDDFRKVNQKHGYRLADEVLIGFADLALAELRCDDLAGRYGENEFIFLLPHSQAEDAFIAMERIRGNLEKKVFKGRRKQEVTITATFGLAHATPDHEEASDLVTATQETLYHAKAAGRNRVMF